MANVGPGDNTFPSSPEGAPRRVSDARTLMASEIDGSRGRDGTTVNLPTVGETNPGATPDLRGVEANTGKITDPGNSHTLVIPPDSWTEMGERYPGDPDGAS